MFRIRVDYGDRRLPALRFRTPGVRFFELDHPGTQSDKRRRLDAMRTSTLVASLAVHRAGLDSDYVASVANARRPNAVREPWRTIMPADDYVAALAGCGWHVRTSTDPAALEPDAPARKTLLVTAHPMWPRQDLPAVLHMHGRRVFNRSR